MVAFQIHIHVKMLRKSTAYQETECQTWIQTIAETPARSAPHAKQTFGQTCNAALRMGTILLVTPLSLFQIGWNASSFARMNKTATISATCWIGRLAPADFTETVTDSLIRAVMQISLAAVLLDQSSLCLVIITVARGDKQQILRFRIFCRQNTILAPSHCLIVSTPMFITQPSRL